MPAERPRYEPRRIEEGPRKGEFEFEEPYTRAEEELKTKEIKNTERPQPGKPPSAPGVEITIRLQRELSDTGKTLKSQFQADSFLEQPDAEAWKTRVAKCGGDLGGYFDNWKFEAVSRAPRVGYHEVDKDLKQLVDVLGIAEVRGGLGGWLDQWYDVVQTRDWDQMAQVAKAIGDGIVFTKGLVDRRYTGFAGSDVEKADLQPDIRELRSVLNAMAFEVARHIDRAITGGIPDVAGRAGAVREALERNSDRARETAEVRAHVDARDASTKVPELSGNLDLDVDVTQRLLQAKGFLGRWDFAAADVSDHEHQRGR